MAEKAERNDNVKRSYAAIVLAGGRGRRMNSRVPKQYLEISGKPVIYYTLKAFQESPVDAIVLVTGKDEIDYCRKEIVERYNFNKVRFVVEGGAERYHSVFNGLQCAADYDYVLIHDGARPFIGKDVICENMKRVVEDRACVTGVPSKDTIKLSDGNGAVEMTPDRNRVWIIQTPQTFETKIILSAYEKILSQPDIHVTDDGMAVETAFNMPVHLVKGDYRNIKITTPEDLKIAEAFVPDFL